ncbi:YggT family protein [Ligilactobacillus agilis]|uniref:YggT family protein n=1 Tax=Ligilactobacillus agilis TaxID=1601 RepID=A0A9Q9MSB2_9LACO|nr:YggT family protein [Ligilactobacillus agilis]UXC62837.1 YggT family protein [Ligilactobacillus agilis]UXC64836.1 YggT family protein [Ligilactobacillus agilis]
MLFTVIINLFSLYELALVVYVLMSWFPGAYQTGLGRFLASICEPYLEIFRFIPSLGGIDFSPLVAFFALGIVEKGLLFFLSLIL